VTYYGSHHVKGPGVLTGAFPESLAATKPAPHFRIFTSLRGG